MRVLSGSFLVICSLFPFPAYPFVNHGSSSSRAVPWTSKSVRLLWPGHVCTGLSRKSPPTSSSHHRARKFDSEERLPTYINNGTSPALISEYVRTFLGDQVEFYLPLSGARPSVASLVRRGFRSPEEFSTEEGSPVPAEPQDQGFAALRYLTGIASRAEQDALAAASGRREPAAKGVRLSGRLSAGAILLAHPMLDGEFARSVVLLCHYSSSKGAYGLIINRPSPMRQESFSWVHVSCLFPNLGARPLFSSAAPHFWMSS